MPLIRQRPSIGGKLPETSEIEQRVTVQLRYVAPAASKDPATGCITTRRSPFL